MLGRTPQVDQVEARLYNEHSAWLMGLGIVRSTVGTNKQSSPENPNHSQVLLHF